MDHLWSPWRAQHLRRSTDADPSDTLDQQGTLFSRMAADDRDAEHLIVWRGRTVFVVMNRYPYNNGHLLIVPYRVVSAYEALTAAERHEIADATALCIRWLQAAVGGEGFNVGMNLGAAAGAGIPEHLHVHVLPRWNGDTNFMPTTARTKVLPEALEDTYRRLRDAADGHVPPPAEPPA